MVLKVFSKLNDSVQIPEHEQVHSISPYALHMHQDLQPKPELADVHKMLFLITISFLSSD